MPNPIALAIPFFFLLIGVEAFLARRRGLRLYRFADMVADLSCGMTQRILLVFEIGALTAVYVWLYGHRLVTFADGSPLPWLVAFVGVDFVYYWWHRLSHEVNFLWAVHVVHHQSEDYNFAVALRQAVLSVWTILPFNLPLALLGVPPAVFLIVDAASALYQFLLHTELVGTLGPVERVLNTPSQHRVHHAANPRYLDRNYGATLCIWDRLFGTFEPETERPVYGLVKPLASFDPMWAQVSSFAELAKRTARQGLLVWLRGPAWGHPAPPELTREGQRKHHVELGRLQLWWVAGNLVLALCVTTALLWFEHSLSRTQAGLVAGFVLLTMASWGALFERRRWHVPLELLRGALAAVTLLAWSRVA